jgi:hypothetical protein
VFDSLLFEILVHDSCSVCLCSRSARNTNNVCTFNISMKLTSAILRMQQHAVDFRKLHELSICSVTASLTMGLESLDSNRIHLSLVMVS